MDTFRKNIHNLARIYKQRICTRVVNVSGKLITVEKGRGKNKEFDLTDLYHVEFLPNRHSYKVGHNSLQLIQKKQLERFFETLDESDLKNQKALRNNKILGEIKYEWASKSIGTNPEQVLAIKNILNCSSFPLPYVILGPRE